MLGSLLDGEAAVSEAKKLLARLGVREKTWLDSLDNHHYISKEKCWSVGLASERRFVNIVLDARTGRVLYLQTLRPPTDPAFFRASNFPPTPQSTHRLRALLHILGYDRDVRLGSDVGFSHGPYQATFYRTVHERPFFNLNPTYGHWLWLEPKDGSLRYFLACPPLPPVNASQPTIDGKAAVAKIEAWAHEQARRKGRSLPQFPSDSDPEPQLGYWKLASEAKARLVWRAARYTRIQGLPYGLGSPRMFVDALSGQLVAPDDPLMGANP